MDFPTTQRWRPQISRRLGSDGWWSLVIPSESLVAEAQ
jgi:hypothetical protein